MKAPLSVLIPTKNEERALPECLASVSWADDIIVYDSKSTDGTVGIASASGAKVIQRSFSNFSSHKNWAIEHIKFKHPWLLILDADERASEGLAEEISTLLSSGPMHNGYYIRRKNYFSDKWMRFGGWFKDYNIRLIRLGCARYEDRIVHEHMLVRGKVGYLKHPIIHFDCKGLERYFDRHNLYSSLEAVEALRITKHDKTPSAITSTLFMKGPHRRRALKNFAYRYIPCRSLFKFLWIYVVKLGFLDGRIGFQFCLLHTFYDYQICLKIQELKKAGSPMQEKYGHYLEN